jgi:hypothetical protein
MRRVLTSLAILLALAACAGPRPAHLQGKICDEVFARGFEPYPWPDPARIASVQAAARQVPVEVTMPAVNRAFRERLRRQYERRGEKVDILAISAGGAWGAFSAGFLDGWRQSTPRQDLAFDVVTGVSTGSLLAPVMFLGKPDHIARVRREYANLTNSSVFTERSLLSLPSSTSLYDTAPLRRKVEQILDEAMIEEIAQQAANRTLAVMAVNLDSSLPEIFDLTRIAAERRPDRRQRIIDAIMASAAIPIGFPPVFIDGNMYVDGGLRAHAFAVQEVVTALRGGQAMREGERLDVYRLGTAGPPIELSIVVSGDMKVMPECVGKKSLGLLAIAQRTATVATDALLRNSVDLLLRSVGGGRGNSAQFIDASAVVTYASPGSGVGSVTRDGKCVVPGDDDDQFVPSFQACLDKAGFALGQTRPIPWKHSFNPGR